MRDMPLKLVARIPWIFTFSGNLKRNGLLTTKNYEWFGDDQLQALRGVIGEVEKELDGAVMTALPQRKFFRNPTSR